MTETNGAQTVRSRIKEHFTLIIDIFKQSNSLSLCAEITSPFAQDLVLLCKAESGIESLDANEKDALSEKLALDSTNSEITSEHPLLPLFRVYRRCFFHLSNEMISRYKENSLEEQDPKFVTSVIEQGFLAGSLLGVMYCTLGDKLRLPPSPEDDTSGDFKGTYSILDQLDQSFNLFLFIAEKGDDAQRSRVLSGCTNRVDAFLVNLSFSMYNTLIKPAERKTLVPDQPVMTAATDAYFAGFLSVMDANRKTQTESH